MSETESNRDWRESAYLRKEKWPAAIPWMGPKREHGPYPWPEKSHHDPHDLDEYPHRHIDAASCGDTYMGDVCPYCGVPVRLDTELVNINGNQGIGFEISPDNNPIPLYHPDCWQEREKTVNQLENRTLDAYQ
jgi:hypothetical protein